MFYFDISTKAQIVNILLEREKNNQPIPVGLLPFFDLNPIKDYCTKEDVKKFADLIDKYPNDKDKVSYKIKLISFITDLLENFHDDYDHRSGAWNFIFGEDSLYLH